MGTRGALGFFANGETKVGYQQFDSYPSGVGAEALDFIATSTLEELRTAANRLVMVTKKTPITQEIVDHCAPFSNLNVSEQSTDDWYCLLREAQGNLEPIVRGGLNYMLDSQDFLEDSLFCEYAYLINTDEGTLEFYKGFQDKRHKIGRYGIAQSKSRKKYKPPYEGAEQYFPVALYLTIPLADIIGSSEDFREKLIGRMGDMEAPEAYTAPLALSVADEAAQIESLGSDIPALGGTQKALT